MTNYDRAIFYHIPKNAGRAMLAFAKDNSLPLYHRGHTAEPWHHGAPTKDFTFCIVRNPYERYVSAINYIIGDRQWPVEYAVRGLFQAFDRKIDLDFIHFLNDDLVKGMVIFKPQMDYVTNDANYDTVFKLEDGMNKICTDIFLQFKPATDTIYPVRTVNHHHGPFTVDDLTTNQKDAIYSRYTKDFDLLHYSK
jgi:hypothetical protein